MTDDSACVQHCSVNTCTQSSCSVLGPARPIADRDSRGGLEQAPPLLPPSCVACFLSESRHSAACQTCAVTSSGQLSSAAASSAPDNVRSALSPAVASSAGEPSTSTDRTVPVSPEGSTMTGVPACMQNLLSATCMHITRPAQVPGAPQRRLHVSDKEVTARKVISIASAVTRATSSLHRPPVHLTMCLNRQFQTISTIFKVSAASTDCRPGASRGHHLDL